MVSFGVGIMLVAQIYHISARPTDGILAWAIGVLAMSVLMKEKWGYYLASALFMLWNLWEYLAQGNPNYFFIIVPLVFFYLFYRSKAPAGIIFALLSFIFW